MRAADFWPKIVSREMIGTIVSIFTATKDFVMLGRTI